MPDILIRMEMPKTCLDCPFMVVFHAKKTGICVAFGDGTNREKMSDRMKATGRMSGCPLHELPEHGDLIDRDTALSHPFANGQYDRENANRHFIGGHESYKEWLEDLHVIVPASEEDG